jgi:hypothetical protein
MTSVLIGGTAAVGFLAMSRLIVPIAQGAGADFATPFSLSNDLLWPLAFGLLVVVLLEIGLAAGL